MKTLKLFFAIAICGISNICYGQKFDTLKFDLEETGLFERIREFDHNDTIRKVWTTISRPNKEIEKQFSEYDESGTRVSRVDSIFYSPKRIKRIDRKLGNTTQGELKDFNTRGNLIRHDISIDLDEKYVIFQKFIDDKVTYRAIIDGHPPEYLEIGSKQFEEAEKLFKKLLIFDSLSK